MLTSNVFANNQLCRHKVTFSVEGAPVADGEWLVCNGVPDGTPHVDDAHTAFEQTLCLFAHVTMHSRDAGFIRLVDMNALDGPANGLAFSIFIARLTAR